jgi:uncharacterized protein YndB with AHSA1/START domain
MSNSNVIDQSISIEASSEQVFNALVDANGLTRWFLSKAESEAKAGGKFKYSWEFNDAEQNGSQEGAYSEVIPNKKVSYPWQAGELPTTVTFTLSDSGDQTTVHLEHVGFGTGENSEQLKEMHDGPWSFYMTNLKSYLENGGDHRSAQIGQVTY